MPTSTDYQSIASSCSHLVLPHSEKLIQSSLDLTKSETRTLQVACSIICILAHFQKNRSRYATYCGERRKQQEQEQEQHSSDDITNEIMNDEHYELEKEDENQSCETRESPRKALMKAAAASSTSSPTNHNDHDDQLLRRLLLLSSSSESSNNNNNIGGGGENMNFDDDSRGSNFDNDQDDSNIPEPIEIVDAKEIIELALKIPGRYMNSFDDMKNDRILLSVKLARCQEGLMTFFDRQLSPFLSLGGIEYCEEITEEEEDQDGYGSASSVIDFEDGDEEGQNQSQRASSAALSFGKASPFITSSKRSATTSSVVSSLASTRTRSISILPPLSSASVSSSSLFFTSSASINNNNNQTQRHRVHQILPTQSEQLTKVLNGGLRVGTVTEICCGKRKRRTTTTLATKRNYEEDIDDNDDDETDNYAKQTEFDSLAAIQTALQLIPPSMPSSSPSPSSSSAAIVSLSSRATNLLLDYYSACSISSSGNTIMNDDITFKEFFPGVKNTNGGRTLLEYLPVLEAQLLSLQNNSTLSSPSSKLKLLMFLDIDAAISSLVTSVDVLKSAAKTVTATTTKSSSSTDSIGEVLFPELKKLAVRLNVAVIVVRLKDSNDLMVGTSALLSLLSSTFGTLLHDSSSSYQQKLSSTQQGGTTAAGGGGGDVASYHAVNCRLRATRKNLLVLGGADRNHENNVMSVEVCKSSWCGMSVTNIEF